MINKDFLKQVFSEEKMLLGLNAVKRVNVPMYNELAVGKLWPEISQDPTFMRYFPDKMAKGRLPDREYFFNVLNTVHEVYVQALIKHANDMRNTAEMKGGAADTIEVSQEWWDKLHAVPFLSQR